MNYDVEIAPEEMRGIVKEAQRLARTWGIPATDRSDRQSFDQALILAAYAAGCARQHGEAEQARREQDKWRSWRVDRRNRHLKDPSTWIFRFHVIAPSGSLETLAMTLAGAKRKMNRLRGQREMS